MITPFDQFVYEAKQVGTLYHWTTFNNMQSILDTDTMLSVRGYISFSRNSRLNYLNQIVKITFDGDAMSNKFKFQPYLFAQINSYKREAEESIQQYEIHGIVKYITKIELYVQKTMGQTLEEKLAIVNACKVKFPHIQFVNLSQTK